VFALNAVSTSSANTSGPSLSPSYVRLAQRHGPTQFLSRLLPINELALAFCQSSPQRATTTLVPNEVRRPRRPQGSFEAEVSLPIRRSAFNRQRAGVRAGSGDPRPQSQPFFISLLVCRPLCKALSFLINLPEKAKPAFPCAQIKT